MHQRIKRYAKNSGFKSPGITFTNKFQKRQALVFSKSKGFETNPHLAPNIDLIRNKAGQIKEIIFYGKSIKPKRKIVLAFMEGSETKMGIVVDFADGIEAQIGLQMLDTFGFDNNLLAYKVEKTTLTKFVPISSMLIKFGNLYVYEYDGSLYALFNEYL